MKPLTADQVEDYVRRLWITSVALRSLGWEPAQLNYDIDVAGIYVQLDGVEAPIAVVMDRIHPESVSEIVARLGLFEATLPYMPNSELTRLWTKYDGEALTGSLRAGGFEHRQA